MMRIAVLDTRMYSNPFNAIGFGAVDTECCKKEKSKVFYMKLLWSVQGVSAIDQIRNGSMRYVKTGACENMVKRVF